MCLLALEAAFWQDIEIEFGSGGRLIRSQFNRCASQMPTVQRCMQNPCSQSGVMAKGTAYLKAEVAGVGVDEAGRDASIPTMTVDEARMGLSHFPNLLDDLFKHAAPDDVTWMIAVQVDLHTEPHSKGISPPAGSTSAMAMLRQLARRHSFRLPTNRSQRADEGIYSRAKMRFMTSTMVAFNSGVMCRWTMRLTSFPRTKTVRLCFW